MFNLPADGYIVYAGLALGVLLLVGAIVFFMNRRKTAAAPAEVELPSGGHEDEDVPVGSLPTPVAGAEEDEGTPNPA